MVALERAIVPTTQRIEATNAPILCTVTATFAMAGLISHPLSRLATANMNAPAPIETKPEEPVLMKLIAVTYATKEQGKNIKTVLSMPIT